ncbi:MAG TPA: hypothetical protein VLU46_02370 [Thermoanaerobaculia bacterium]|nr:hypothetical protein [Thermoanaerobaculia bacterium]
MPDELDCERDVTIPEGKRDERERPDPQNQPAEFADDMRANTSDEK